MPRDVASSKPWRKVLAATIAKKGNGHDTNLENWAIRLATGVGLGHCQAAPHYSHQIVALEFLPKASGSLLG